MRPAVETSRIARPGVIHPGAGACRDPRPQTGRAGVGLLFNGALGDLLEVEPDAVDFLSIIPERFWQDFGRNRPDRFAPLPDEVELLDRLASRHRLVAHGVGLSIASGSTFDVDHVLQLAAWHRRYRFAWISEHLSAVRVRTEETPDHHAGLTLPLAWDHDLLDLLSERVARVQDILGARLLLENGVVHTPVPGSDMSEEEFLNALVRRTGCGLLLDLHNLHVNAVNLGLDPDRFLDGLDLDAVGEIHVAGGNRLFGAYLDSHAGACPGEVWRLLDRVAPRCANLEGVTFEFHETYFPGLGADGVRGELQRMRAAVNG
ncbi:DUF692 domain-containing protein [Reyranella sp.]|uniref:DUF692 domain-containing protein n=1 Tax=Reyranella sp. TaxID=1929291 RepID=UPI003BABB1F1